MFQCYVCLPMRICVRAMDISRLLSSVPVIALAVGLCSEVGAAGRTCDAMQVRDCYSGIMDSIVHEFSQHPFNISRLDGLCAEHGPTSQCAVKLADCSHPTLVAMEKVYAIIRDEACGDSDRRLLKTLLPSAKCHALPLLTKCVEKKLKDFDNSSEEVKSHCRPTGTSPRRWTARPRVDPLISPVTEEPGKVPASAVLHNQFDWSDDLEAELTRCLISVGAPCRPNKGRPRYAQRTLAGLLELKGCTLSDNNPFLETEDARLMNDEAHPDSSQVPCSYKQMKRCLEKQINDIQRGMNNILMKELTPNDRFMAAICRKTRKMCHQHNRVNTCDADQQDAIRRMEEAMDLAQGMLCKNNRTLLKSLLFSYKSWNIQGFARCSRDVQVNSLTDHLFRTQRIEADCRKLKSRVYRCFNESYAPVANEADPEPNVAGAVAVLSAFLDRLKCVDGEDVPTRDGGADNTSDYNDVDYPADQAPYTDDKSVGAITAQPSKESASGVDMLKPSTSMFVGLVSVFLFPRLGQRRAFTE